MSQPHFGFPRKLLFISEDKKFAEDIVQNDNHNLGSKRFDGIDSRTIHIDKLTNDLRILGHKDGSHQEIQNESAHSSEREDN